MSDDKFKTELQLFNKLALQPGRVGDAFKALLADRIT